MSQEISVSAADYGAAMFYDQMADRVEKLPDDRAIPLMAARLYCKRVGPDQFFGDIIALGVPTVAARCRAEMMVRHEFLVRMIQEHGESDEIEGAAEELAADLATFDSPPATMYLLKYLDRIQRAELRRIAVSQSAPH